MSILRNAFKNFFTPFNVYKYQNTDFDGTLVRMGHLNGILKYLFKIQKITKAELDTYTPLDTQELELVFVIDYGDEGAYYGWNPTIQKWVHVG